MFNSEKIKKYGVFALVGVVAIVLIVALTSGCKHNWIARCGMPETCMKCGEERGEILEHNYSEGKCLKCGRRDPDFVDLNNYGFSYMYGMNEWVEVTTYDSSDRSVLGSYNSKVVRIYCFYDNYYKCDHAVGVKGLMSGDFYSDVQNVVFTRVNNNSINSEKGNWTIFERKIISNDCLIIKTKVAGKERWFVPVQHLDLSRSEIIEGPTGASYVKMYFKK